MKTTLRFIIAAFGLATFNLSVAMNRDALAVAVT